MQGVMERWAGYRRAYAAEKMKDETINRVAFDLLNNPKITARIKELQGELKAASDITKERVLEELSAIAFAKIFGSVHYRTTVPHGLVASSVR